jgi:deferrochelatase/peroxidase EfeB
MSGLRAFQRRSFLQGVVSGLAGAVVAGSVDHGVARAATEDDYNLEATREGVRSVPFYGRNQAGIGTAPQTAASFLVFEVTAANRGELTALLRTLTARAAFLTAGGTPPPTPTTRGGCGSVSTGSGSRRVRWVCRGTGWVSRTASPIPTPPTPSALARMSVVDGRAVVVVSLGQIG